MKCPLCDYGSLKFFRGESGNIEAIKCTPDKLEPLKIKNRGTACQHNFNPATPLFSCLVQVYQIVIDSNERQRRMRDKFREDFGKLQENLSLDVNTEIKQAKEQYADNLQLVLAFLSGYDKEWEKKTPKEEAHE